MMHVKQIRDIVDEGRTEDAHSALDQLLALGPNNTEALKLRAQLLEFEGRFADEAKIWERIAGIDREDPDAITFLLRKQLEDREHFYFTDDLPGGGRRFMAYPRGLVNTSAMGLMGCVSFLLSTRLAGFYPILNEPAVMLGLFGLFVLLPWVGIVVSYFRSMKSVSVTTQGIAIATRLRHVELPWSDLEKVCLARSLKRDYHHLSLVLIPKDRTLSPIEIDLDQASTAIRARSYLVREIARSFSEPEYARREALGLDQRKVQTF
jgi:hypothetical protein